MVFRLFVNQSVRVGEKEARIANFSDRGDVQSPVQDNGEYEWWAYEAVVPVD